MAQLYDLVVIGSGWFGISAAKTYIETHPEEKILILEASSTCGGTWSSDRLYPGLKSNNIIGSYQHPDVPMSEEKYGVKEGEHIPGAVLHRYLTDISKQFGVYERTCFETKVETVMPSKKCSGWELKLATPVDGEDHIDTKKLIVATGLTSTPNIPQYPGQETLTVPFFHAKDFYLRKEILETAKDVVVIGGAKSALDIAHAFATAHDDCTVHLIIRPTGQGPVWLLPPYVTPLKRKAEELLHTRFLTWFSPSPYGNEDGFSTFRNFLHGTRLGRWLCRGFWSILSHDVTDAIGFDKDPILGSLKPWNSAFWSGSGISIHNYDSSLWDLVKRGTIKVHTSDISSLKEDTVLLYDGTALRTDVVVCATGWRKDPTLKFLNIPEAGISLPFTPEEQAKLNAETDQKVLTMFPSLKDQPTPKSKPAKEEPLRLYRFIVPPTMVQSRNLAFAGICRHAFFDGKLERLAKSEEEITKEVMLHTQFGKWRYPCGYGARLPDFAFDGLNYVDLCMRDLGLENQRKRGDQGLMAELFKPYKPWDYEGLVGEWLEAQEKKKEKMA